MSDYIDPARITPTALAAVANGPILRGTRVVSVDEFGTNPFALRGVYGNVDDWCEDHVHGDYQGAPADGSAWINAGATPNSYAGYRVMRGGSWEDLPMNLRSAARNFNFPQAATTKIGFRVARTLLSQKP
jgi:formylglycine-generating enzyme required for sulfatase activity